MDWFAVTSYGAYPAAATLVGPRANYAVSFGLFGAFPGGSIGYLVYVWRRVT